MTDPEVSVVIPSQAGEHLERAVESALKQRDVNLEVIVVLNNPRRSYVPDDDRVRVLSSTATGGANEARQTGIDGARAPFIAMLDDDDYWLPDKLAMQLPVAQQANVGERTVLVGCTITEIRSNGRTTTAPRSPVERVDDISSYLFVRPRLKSNRPQLQTSTLLFPRRFGEVVRFHSERRFHQDWTWLLDAEKAGASAVVVAAPLVFREVQTSSISSRITWRQSLEWGQEQLSSRRTFGDFALTMAVLKAARAGDVFGVVSCLRVGVVRGRPGFPALVFALTETARAFQIRLLRVMKGRKRP